MWYARLISRAQVPSKQPTLMTILLSTVLATAMTPDDRVRNIAVRVVQVMPYAFTSGSGFFRANSSVLSLDKGKGFQPSLGALWVPFQYRNATGNKSNALYGVMQTTTDVRTRSARVSTITTSLPACPIGHVACEDDGMLQSELRLAKPAEGHGFVGVTVEAYVHGPQPRGETANPDTTGLHIRHR